MKVCATEGCGRPTRQRHRLCGGCQWGIKHHGSPLARRVGTPIERFTRQYEVKPSGCWEWTGWARAGYGLLSVDGATMSAHRWSYEHFVGPIPEGLFLDHLCRNPSCVNPNHLEAVTHRENCLRGEGPTAINASKTHCKRGHEFTPENTYVHANQRSCRACTNERARRRRTGA